MKEDISVWFFVAIGVMLALWFGISVTDYRSTKQLVKELAGADNLPTTHFMRGLKKFGVKLTDERIKGFMGSVRQTDYYFKDTEYWNEISFLMADNSHLIERIFERSQRYGWDEESFEALGCILYVHDDNHHYIGTRLVLRWVKDVHNAIITDLLKGK